MGSQLVKFEPMAHQLKMCKYLVRNNGGLLFCEMRTGKTLGVILFLITNRKVPILIVAPCMAMRNWYDWLVAQGFKENMLSLLEGTKKKRQKELDKGKPIIMCNYEMSIKYKIKNLQNWAVIIFDESYRLANISASVTQYWIRGTRPEGQARIAVSGEPAPESPLNFASQYMIICGQFMGYSSYMSYLRNEWRENPWSGKLEPVRPTHEAEIRVYVKKTAHCVTMKSLGLGSKTLYNATFFELNTAQKKIMKEVKKLRDKADMMKGVPMMENPYKIKAFTMERLVSAGMDPENHEIINQDKLIYMLTSYLEDPEPIVILSHYKAPLFRAQELFHQKGIKSGLIYGGTGSSSQKEEIVNQFKDGEFPVFFGQTRSVKMNYNLSRSSLTYYPNNSYSRDDRAQSEKRTTNIKKDTPVGIMDLCYRDTMDEKLVKLLRAKEKISYSFIDTEFHDACFDKQT